MAICIQCGKKTKNKSLSLCESCRFERYKELMDKKKNRRKKDKDGWVKM